MRPLDTVCWTPSTTSVDTPPPERSPAAVPGLAVALARATTSLAVTSPPKSERSITSAEAVPKGLPEASAFAVAMYAPVVTTGVPSAALNENAAPPAATWLWGGDARTGVEEVARPGAMTRIAYARAVAPAPPAGDCAPAAPAPRSASESARAIRSRSDTRLHSME